jgi:hypothetical protein
VRAEQRAESEPIRIRTSEWERLLLLMEGVVSDIFCCRRVGDFGAAAKAVRKETHTSSCLPAVALDCSFFFSPHVKQGIQSSYRVHATSRRVPIIIREVVVVVVALILQQNNVCTLICVVVFPILLSPLQQQKLPETTRIREILPLTSIIVHALIHRRIIITCVSG